MEFNPLLRKDAALFCYCETLGETFFEIQLVLPTETRAEAWPFIVVPFSD
jgi:hypothetical protein